MNRRIIENRIGPLEINNQDTKNPKFGYVKRFAKTNLHNMIPKFRWHNMCERFLHKIGSGESPLRSPAHYIICLTLQITSMIDDDYDDGDNMIIAIVVMTTFVEDKRIIMVSVLTSSPIVIVNIITIITVIIIMTTWCHC